MEFFAFHASALALILDREEGLRKLSELGNNSAYQQPECPGSKSRAFNPARIEDSS
jgi:hypothetical protein